MTWTIVVTNNGPSPAINATVMDTFHPAFLSPIWTCTASSRLELRRGALAPATLPRCDPCRRAERRRSRRRPGRSVRDDVAEQHGVRVAAASGTSDPVPGQQQRHERRSDRRLRRSAGDQSWSRTRETGIDDHLHDHGDQCRTASAPAVTSPIRRPPGLTFRGERRGVLRRRSRARSARWRRARHAPLRRAMPYRRHRRRRWSSRTRQR